MEKEKVIFAQRSVALQALPELCAELRQVLEQAKPFVLLLEGEMGSGKTTFVREYLKSCGLASETPVISPTYTIVNEYRLNKQWYAHLDLYRAGSNFSFEELGLTDLQEHRGFFVEWPKQADFTNILQPTHLLIIDNSDSLDPSYRLYSLSSFEG